MYSTYPMDTTYIEGHYRLFAALGCPVLFILGGTMLSHPLGRRICAVIAWGCMLFSVVFCVLNGFWTGLTWPGLGVALWLWVSGVYRRRDGLF